MRLLLFALALASGHSHTLIVQKGIGSGVYESGAVIDITADYRYIPKGCKFALWHSDAPIRFEWPQRWQTRVTIPTYDVTVSYSYFCPTP